MRVIVHYGMAKTGTTSIQLSLRAARRDLLRQGVLYPKTIHPRKCHHFILPLFSEPDEIPLQMRNTFRGDVSRLRAAARRNWERIKRQVDRHKPKALVLSSEFLFFNVTPANQARLCELLNEIGTEVQPCVYVRAPADHFLSMRQQVIKQSGLLAQPQPLRVRKSVEVIENAFGTDVVVLPFERRQLNGGDVVVDFVERLLGAWVDSKQVRSIRANVSLSAEAMSIFHTYRAYNRSASSRPSREHTGRLRELIDACEANDARHNRPRLREPLGLAINRASIDLLWLRERYGLEFENIDYGQIDGQPLDQWPEVKCVNDLCHVDHQWRDELLHKVLHLALHADQGGLARLGTALSKLRPRGS